jgi:hypothetical protein
MPSFTLVELLSTTSKGRLMTPVASKKYKLKAPLSPLVKFANPTGAELVSLATSRLLVKSMKRSRAMV